MKTISICILLFVGIPVMAQFGEVSREELVGYEKIIAKSTSYNDSDSSFRKTVFLLNDLGAIIKSESFENDELEYCMIFEYDSLGNLIAEESYSQIFEYSEEAGEHVPVWRDGYFNGKELKYNGNRLVEEKLFNCVDNHRSYNYFYFHTYDDKGRKSKTEYVDTYIGLTGEFEPNSSNLKSLYNKNQASKSYSTYAYLTDSVIEQHLDENDEITGYTHTKVNSQNSAISQIHTDSILGLCINKD